MFDVDFKAPGPFVSVQQVADHFHVRMATVLACIDSGLLPARRVRGTWCIRSEDALELERSGALSSRETSR